MVLFRIMAYGRSVLCSSYLEASAQSFHIAVDVLNKKLEAKAKALIALEEQEYSTRPMVSSVSDAELALQEH